MNRRAIPFAENANAIPLRKGGRKEELAVFSVLSANNPIE
jgi:hypothetical protein